MNNLKDRLVKAGFTVKDSPRGGGMVTAGVGDVPRLRSITDEVYGPTKHTGPPIFWWKAGETQASLIIHGNESRLYFAE